MNIAKFYNAAGELRRVRLGKLKPRRRYLFTDKDGKLMLSARPKHPTIGQARQHMAQRGFFQQRPQLELRDKAAA